MHGSGLAVGRVTSPPTIRVAQLSSQARSWTNRCFPQERVIQMELIFLLVMLGTLDIASLSWSFNSNDGVESPEWERRQRWYGFH
jgi:hypothetical protein